MTSPNREVQPASDALEKAARTLCNDLVKLGYGMTSDRPLPGSFDTLFALIFSQTGEETK